MIPEQSEHTTEPASFLKLKLMILVHAYKWIAGMMLNALIQKSSRHNAPSCIVAITLKSWESYIKDMFNQLMTFVIVFLRLDG